MVYFSIIMVVYFSIIIYNSEVLEWTLELPDTVYTLFSPYFDGAISENDPTKSYSVADFVKGMFYGGVVNKILKPNYILISKNS